VEEEEVGSYWMNFTKIKVMEFESGSTRQQSLGNSFWKRIQTSCNSEYVMIMMMMMIIIIIIIIITLRSLFTAPMNLKMALSLCIFLLVTLS